MKFLCQSETLTSLQRTAEYFTDSSLSFISGNFFAKHSFCADNLNKILI